MITQIKKHGWWLAYNKWNTRQ